MILPSELMRNVEDIAAELDCDIDWVYGLGGMMFVEEKPPRIEIPMKHFWATDAEKCYAVSLHELGHVFHGHTQGRPPYENEIYYFENGVLRSEAEAWKFALENSIIDWTKKTKEFALRTCLMSYYYGAISAGDKPDRLTNGNRSYHEFIWDKPDDLFWEIFKELGK